MRYWDDDQILAFLAATKDVNAGVLKLQRLRVMAKQALVAGDVKGCDQYHLESIQLAGSIYESGNHFMAENLVRQRAKDLVLLNQLVDAKTLLDVGHRDIYIRTSVAEGARLMDSKTVDWWFNKAQESGVEEETQSQILSHRANVQLEQGDIPGAIDSFQQSLKGISEEHTWIASARRNKLIELLLSTGNTTAAKLRLTEQTETEQPFSADTTIDLAEGRFDSLLEQLRAAKKDDARIWLGSEARRELLRRHVRTQKSKKFLVKLFDEFPLNLGYGRERNWGTSFFRRIS